MFFIKIYLIFRDFFNRFLTHCLATSDYTVKMAAFTARYAAIRLRASEKRPHTFCNPRNRIWFKISAASFESRQAAGQRITKRSVKYGDCAKVSAGGVPLSVPDPFPAAGAFVPVRLLFIVRKAANGFQNPDFRL